MAISTFGNDKERNQFIAELRKRDQMTIERFTTMIEDPNGEFLEKFTNQLEKLCGEKISKYSNPAELPIRKQKKKKEEEEPTDIHEKDIYAMCIKKAKGIVAAIRDEREDFKKNLKKSMLSAINDPKQGLMTLTGREEQISTILSVLVAFSHTYRTVYDSYVNFVIVGKSGTGKSHLGRVIANVFSNSHILLFGSTAKVTSTDLIAGHMGGTGEHTRGIFFRGLEGVLFIDEAYSITGCKEDNGGRFEQYGLIAVAELLDFMSKTVGLMIVVVAGYEDKMKRCFFASNEGLARRFPRWMYLDDYTVKDLGTEIVKRVKEALKTATLACDETLYNRIEKLVGEIGSHADSFSHQMGDAMNLADEISQSILKNVEEPHERVDIAFKLYMANKNLKYDPSQEVEGSIKQCWWQTPTSNETPPIIISSGSSSKVKSKRKRVVRVEESDEESEEEEDDDDSEYIPSPKYRSKASSRRK